MVKGVKRIVETTKNKKVKGISFDDAAKIGKKNMSKNATAELILQKSGQTARLSEIKMKSQIKNKDSNPKAPKRSYSAEMKKLLRESLRKNDKVR